MYKILVSNDDGINAEGLRALVKALGSMADVYIAAPAEQNSAVSQAITFRRNVKATKVEKKHTRAAWAITGTPADCVKLGIQLMRERNVEPDFVISGINMGINTGSSVVYSGTLAAAREGALSGIRSIALSVASHDAEHFDYICEMIRGLLDLSMTLEPSTILSVNTPNLPPWKIKGVRFAPCAEHAFGELFVFEKRPEEDEYGMIIQSLDSDPTVDNDWNAVKHGYAVITPILVETTDRQALRKIKGLSNDSTVCVFVDFQEKLMPAMRKNEELADNVVRFARCMKRLDVPMIATTQYSKGLGPTFAELDKAMGKHKTIEKITFDCFGEKNFAKEFEGMISNKVIIAGIEAHICLQQTALSFLERGYDVYVVSDCCQSRKKKDYKAAMQLLEAKGCNIRTWESVVYDVMKSAQHPAFKTVSKIVKGE